MTHEELMVFKENIAVPRMMEIFEKTEIPEGLCIIDNAKISFLDGRSCGHETLMEASGLVYKDGKVSQYSYEELDVSVADFVEAHKGAVLLLDGKFQVFDELQEMDIQTVIRSLDCCIKVFPELEKLNDLEFDGPSFVWEKMKFLYSSEMEKYGVKKRLEEKLAQAVGKVSTSKLIGKETGEITM